MWSHELRVIETPASSITVISELCDVSGGSSCSSGPPKAVLLVAAALVASKH